MSRSQLSAGSGMFSTIRVNPTGSSAFTLMPYAGPASPKLVVMPTIPAFAVG
ncbi:Uncharacterised protein [Mycobacteroides abscessus subsp. abscessus]|nr:Uncharacterised protein [Mycobacteroides abscessus subsp. abscessus]